MSIVRGYARALEHQEREAEETLIAAKTDLGAVLAAAKALEEQKSGSGYATELRDALISLLTAKRAAELQVKAINSVRELYLVGENPLESKLRGIVELAKQRREAISRRRQVEKQNEAESAAEGENVDGGAVKTERKSKASSGTKNRGTKRAQSGGAKETDDDKEEDEHEVAQLRADVRSVLESFDFVKAYEQALARLTREDNWKPQTDEGYISYRRTVWSVHHRGEALPEDDDGSGDEEADIVIGGSEGDFNCPITREELVNPYTNHDCKHSYSKDAIDDLLSRQQRVRCPVPGCSKFISRASLVKDDLKARLIKDRKDESQRRAKRARVWGTQAQSLGDDEEVEHL